ncbi:hypothetical protein [Brachyspira hampsonii]|uniref:Lipoprotein n=1 Tax=Brachyspira hampsonii TaxID=1287055 RepID=A0AAC9TSB2_9SPIR|nr:hypothetical protein [Brachyspira hampsonii]ASJ20911.1 hypothetical protein BHAMNSH16_04315 [Brachyspira hampsonii]ELV05380.1 hypothetical protein H263_10609 [Brachyspira hampsonii 30599]MBW5379758.1 hypothetical protein [Brachyspira hampsonii]MBW5409933.1 hypothetical protein [Brachyspira hampsonii]OEJ18890.1 hypothetical protein A9496_05640 [Brachyspira hampsonii]
MIKKLFLFTLLVSSFLVISCSNKDTTGSTGTGIDSKWYGTYSGNIYDPNGSSAAIQVTLKVDSTGATITMMGLPLPTLPQEVIVKDSDTKYHSLSNNENSFTFVFDSGGVNLTVNPNSGSGYLTKQ